MQSEFKDYFENEIDYPRNILVDILPVDTIWWYISHTFLNGMINYVDVKAAFLMDRYQPLDEQMEGEDLSGVSYQEPAGSFKWAHVDKPMTKRELYNLLTEKNRLVHTNISCLRDDVLILAKPESDDQTDIWYFFWFDRDVSDCAIGRFRTDDAQEVVIAKFEEYVKALDCGKNALPLPLHFFEGRLSF